jgi:hypothetical protein
VDPVLLVSSIGTAGAGAWLGAGVVSRLPRRTVALVMGVALIVAGIVFAATNLGLLPGGGTAMALAGWRFWFAVFGNFFLGAIMSGGIGMYAREPAAGHFAQPLPAHRPGVVAAPTTAPPAAPASAPTAGLKPATAPNAAPPPAPINPPDTARSPGLLPHPAKPNASSTAPQILHV